jgi:ATP adenylyltransferase
MAYLRDLERRRAEIPEGEPVLSDFIAAAWAAPRFPYSNGHLLIALGVAKPRLLDHTIEERAAFWGLVDHAVDLVERAFNPHGINMGVNQGDAAGAGLPAHLHAHVVPRWNGDVNFMTSIGGLRVVPESLEEVLATYRALPDR